LTGIADVVSRAKKGRVIIEVWTQRHSPKADVSPAAPFFYRGFISVESGMKCTEKEEGERVRSDFPLPAVI
jgi:hypothetical protein